MEGASGPSDAISGWTALILLWAILSIALCMFYSPMNAQLILKLLLGRALVLLSKMILEFLVEKVLYRRAG